ncbi:radical SAM protein, partial [Citrobacter sp. TBCS-11]
MLTNKCNLRCKFCYLEDYQGKELELDEINHVLDIIQDKEFTHVSLLGGEPTECEVTILLSCTIVGKRRN